MPVYSLLDASCGLRETEQKQEEGILPDSVALLARRCSENVQAIVECGAAEKLHCGSGGAFVHQQKQTGQGSSIHRIAHQNAMLLMVFI